MGYKTWTSEEEAQLLGLREKNPKISFKDMGVILGRTTSMTCNKWQLLTGIQHKKRNVVNETNDRQKKFDMLRAGQTILTRKLLNTSVRGKYSDSAKMKIIANNGSQIICKTEKGIEGITMGAIISKEYLISIVKEGVTA